MKKIIIIGSAHPLRGGGIATFNERLAREFQQQGFDTTIYTFSLQYPSFLFPGTTQYSSEPAPKDIRIKVAINSINPFNWFKVGREIKKLNPDIVLVRYWLPLMGPCLGTILRIIKKNRHSRVVCIADNVIPHEKRPGDYAFTKYFVKPVDAFIALSESVLRDIKQFSNRPSRLIMHPLYDNFGTPLNKAEARKHLGLKDHEKIILFFGFIRKYKGLDVLLQAMADERIRQAGIKLMVAGEFYGERDTYDKLIDELELRPRLILKTDFITDSEVKYYLGAADFVIQPYRSATQSGVTPLAYHFEKPMLVTNVGGLPSFVPHEKAGLVAEPNAADIAEKILRLYQLGESHFLPHLREEKKKYTWDVLVKAVEELAEMS
ncbi:glycosyltransferase family 4 protein [Foetidibacter luteolus]|uniref:glycosyltransferase family 4 protein n=1 Tax=Foetidibacter luteolus TaxID=2608880 RepID=UPI00129B2211|nr:glycosyltransferase family 4 protein [Foetidibacter luteolus]